MYTNGIWGLGVKKNSTKTQVKQLVAGGTLDPLFFVKLCKKVLADSVDAIYNFLYQLDLCTHAHTMLSRSRTGTSLKKHCLR